MSLHAQLSPEAQARLAAQQRNSTITSIIISLLVVTLIGIILLFLLLPPVDNFTPEIVSYQSGADDKEKVTKREMTRAVERKPSAPSSSMAKVIAANTSSTTAVPVPEIDVPDPSMDFGNGDDFGDGWGSGDGEGGGGGFGSIPATMRERCSRDDRLNRLAKNGGNEKCEEAVMSSLRWLKKTQNKDGSWTDQKVAMTGFALLAFLGHCETPNSEEFGDAVTRAIVYLVNVSMKNGGKMADDFKDRHWPYEHSIATYALGEAATFCIKLGINIPKLNDATKKSGDWILEHQHSSGAWDYDYDMSGKRGGDTSIALWHIQALKACKHTGLWEEKTFTSPIRESLEYLKSKQSSDGGVGYTAPKPHGEKGFTMTGGGMLAFQMWGKSHDSVVRKGSRYIQKNAKFDWNTADSDLYRHYYHAQAMINRGGKEWDNYNNMFRDQLLNNQNKDGTYKNVGGGAKVNGVAARFQGGSEVAVHYRTCLATFMLEVYYRFLPATGSKH
ncbi:terpene cyclase/mutase family protein [Verrucomicrobiaceae bacterium R5-34]|uniref:Terpene cyclase/mutase family protein n=1 Tax=Oceaniferula flava TaxID=2800421 RepID=A0AAE2S9J9_9BACT|nr:terpene cyclase/mutase family protein [Oceaniferula flavus]MBK1831508.1 terpene cyclase/mutase family protein [Verrucomicrobiaceae bacterium R5-34]MBK1854253.1 terpene cyclase/mutase family protein [Oceaniferula flavus]MBM1135559.1 terpene cyclase/mutase family protein [Oceaniferula flavus]